MHSYRTKIAGPAGFAAVIIAIIFAIYQVQGWKMPTPLAVFLLATLFLMLFTSLGIICFELISVSRQFLEHRATSASWLSREAPGLLDYEADGERASQRFLKEINKLAIDTQKLGDILAKHT